MRDLSYPLLFRNCRDGFYSTIDRMWGWLSLFSFLLLSLHLLSFSHPSLSAVFYFCQQ